MTDKQTPTGSQVDTNALLGATGRIPRKVAVCPECRHLLDYSVIYEDEDGNIDVVLVCTGPDRTRAGDDTHRFHQSEWEQTDRICTEWVTKHAAPNTVLDGT